MRIASALKVITPLLVLAITTCSASVGAAAAGTAAFVVEGGTLCAAAAIGDSSATYRLDWTAGELGVGDGESPSYRVSVGFWGECSCPFQADFDADGFLNPLDLNALIDALFFGGPDPHDPDCPTTRGDFNNDGAPDPLDLNDLIDYLFFAGSPPSDPCAP